jgi:hypothetical protein
VASFGGLQNVKYFTSISSKRPKAMISSNYFENKHLQRESDMYAIFAHAGQKRQKNAKSNSRGINQPRCWVVIEVKPLSPF